MIFILFIVLLVGMMIYHLIRRHYTYKVESEKLGDAPGWDDFIFVKYKGEDIPMRVWEYHEIWQFLDREQKRKQAMEIRKAIKKGKLSGHFKDHEDIVVYATE